jgi:aspartate-semialdehyde dehydrogenase
VRIPTIGGHSEAVNVEFHTDFDLKDVRQILENAPGVIVQDDVKHNVYPMPIKFPREGRSFCWSHPKR